MSKREFLYVIMGFFILLNFLSFAFAEEQCENQTSREEVSMEVKVNIVSKEITFSERVFKELQNIVTEMIKTHFPVEYTKSGKITAEIKVLERTENGYLCESIIGFLYKETFTLVLVRVEFEYIPAQIKNVKIQRNYSP